MSYEILRDDLGEDKKSSKKPQSKKMGKVKQMTKVNPVYIHITLILIILGLLFLYFLDDVSFDFQESKKAEIVTLIGDLSDFNEEYSGNIDIVASNFRLETPTGEFDVTSADVKVDGFNGSIYVGDNSSIILDGSAKRIEYGKNRINLDGNSFKFISGKKVSMDLYFGSLNLDFESGRVKIDESFNYNFENSNISVSNFNSSLTYDGTFLFTGTLDNFVLNSKNPTLEIHYQNE